MKNIWDYRLWWVNLEEFFFSLRVWVKLQGLKEKLLSKAGSKVLIKVVAQAIPTYAMSVFQLPVSLYFEFNRIVSNFWWGNSQIGEESIGFPRINYACQNLREAWDFVI
ncbi:hypothetical protein CFOL_v3_15245 [Cephalotus follicularis]|uniref:DUF4283 domain-containing protein n=1 Tax=Cephalotus follicularis TaxID=3775 RepID=A0A1Q3BUX1_CEPFO|nr:hypothetical protein CFOL_v3_15245 [Cephalotus follicularis]